MADKIKIVLAVLLVAAGLAGFYYFGDSPAIVRLGSVLAGLLAAAFVFWTTVPGKQFYVYAQESAAETRKVVWPTRKETIQTTAVVFLFVIAMALFLWAVDASLLWIVKKLIGTGE
ncbi:MAG TPA: preprotein translocase subunit SecE [Burkholderiales bacterium]|nr:preprotein translocase subunit SecE [Burkholderiales bacterium]